MAFSMAVRARPRGAARPCSHSCSVRFEICNFNAASLCDKLFRSRHARSLRGNAPAANLSCRTCSGSVPKPSLRCYTGLTYSIKSIGQNDLIRGEENFAMFNYEVRIFHASVAASKHRCEQAKSALRAFLRFTGERTQLLDCTRPRRSNFPGFNLA